MMLWFSQEPEQQITEHASVLQPHHIYTPTLGQAEATESDLSPVLENMDPVIKTAARQSKQLLLPAGVRVLLLSVSSLHVAQPHFFFQLELSVVDSFQEVLPLHVPKRTKQNVRKMNFCKPQGPIEPCRKPPLRAFVLRDALSSFHK